MLSNFSAKRRKEVIVEHQAGETIPYTGGSLAELFQ